MPVETGTTPRRGSHADGAGPSAQLGEVWLLPDRNQPSDAPVPQDDAERRRRRAQFLRELNEAKALRERVKPRRARAARMRQQMRMRTFRW
ncbi:hypothetical protein ABZW18_16250 [Streptomyces sp. NPDC004647]|uniref:hypothetical protein n=1 Tax=Streptomyces sp. NPDC004647 TaxID=3154671 RepID=UPI0033B37CFE